MTDDTISRPSRTTAAAVSSQDVSMPSTNMREYSNLRRSSVTNRLVLKSVFLPTCRLSQATCFCDDARRLTDLRSYRADLEFVNNPPDMEDRKKQYPTDNL